MVEALDVIRHTYMKKAVQLLHYCQNDMHTCHKKNYLWLHSQKEIAPKLHLSFPTVLSKVHIRYVSYVPFTLKCGYNVPLK